MDNDQQYHHHYERLWEWNGHDQHSGGSRAWQYWCLRMTGRVSLSDDDKKKPKWRKMHCLDTRYVLFFLHFFIHKLMDFTSSRRFYQCFRMTGRASLGDDNKNRPKWPGYIFFLTTSTMMTWRDDGDCKLYSYLYLVFNCRSIEY